MKNIYQFFVSLLLLSFCVPAQGALIIKATSIDTVRASAHSYPSPVKGEQKSGWAGITALICGVAAVATGAAGLPLLFFIPAVIFGIVGVGKNRRYQTLAAVGIVLGVVGLFLLLLV